MPGLFRLCQQFLMKLMKLRGKVSMLSDANQNWIFKCWTASRIWFSIPHLTGPLANGGAREGLRTLNMGRGNTPRVPAQPRHRVSAGFFRSRDSCWLFIFSVSRRNAGSPVFACRVHRSGARPSWNSLFLSRRSNSIFSTSQGGLFWLFLLAVDSGARVYLCIRCWYRMHRYKQDCYYSYPETKRLRFSIPRVFSLLFL